VHWIRHPGLMNFGAPSLILALIGVALVIWTRSRPLDAFAALWIILFLGPVLDLTLLPSGNFIQDRYLYLPSIGFSILVVEFLARVFSRQRGPERLSGAAGVFALAILMAYATSTLVQSTYWANDLLLFDQALKVAPHNAYASNGLGTAMMNHHHYRQAVKLFRAAIAASPKLGYPWGNLAYLYYETARYSRAVTSAEQYLRIYPKAPDGFYLLGISEYQLGHYHRAAASLGYAASLNPHAYGFHYALGLALLKEGHSERALLEFEAEPSHSTKRADAERQISALKKALRDVPAKSSAAP
jgi:tetratricopeptide (TPR) repeat protein